MAPTATLSCVGSYWPGAQSAHRASDSYIAQSTHIIFYLTVGRLQKVGRQFIPASAVRHSNTVPTGASGETGSSVMEDQ